MNRGKDGWLGGLSTILVEGYGHRRCLSCPCVAGSLALSDVFPHVLVTSLAVLLVLVVGFLAQITAIPILVERCGGNRRVASQFVVAGFIFSVLSITAFIYLFNKFFPMPL